MLQMDGAVEVGKLKITYPVAFPPHVRVHLSDHECICALFGSMSIWTSRSVMLYGNVTAQDPAHDPLSVVTRAVTAPLPSALLIFCTVADRVEVQKVLAVSGVTSKSSTGLAPAAVYSTSSPSHCSFADSNKHKSRQSLSPVDSGTRSITCTQRTLVTLLLLQHAVMRRIKANMSQYLFKGDGSTTRT